MQPLVDGPRAGLTEEQVLASLAWQHSTQVRWGVDVLDALTLAPTGIELDVTDADVSWQWRAQPVEGQAPVSAHVRRRGSLRYRHLPNFNPLAVLYRPWVEMRGPDGKTDSLFFDGVDDQVTIPGIQKVTNLVTNPSAEVDISGWSSYAANPTRTTTQHDNGIAAFQIQVIGFDNPFLDNRTNLIPVTAGLPYSASCRFKAATTPRDCRFIFMWKDAPTADFTTIRQDVSGTVTSSTTEWTTVEFENVVAPATATHLMIACSVLSTTADELHFVDSIIVVQDEQVPPYFDGDSNAASWDGTPHSSTSHIGGLLAPAQQVTWEIVFRVGDTPDPFDTLMGFQSNNWDIRMDSGTTSQLHWWDSNGAQTFNGFTIAETLYDGEWHRLAAVWDGVNGTRFTRIDGVTVFSSSMAPGSMPRDMSDFENFFIGAIGGGRNFNGWIDEVRIWSTPRSTTQLDDNAPLNGDEDGLVAYWRFDDGEGTTLTDYGPNGLHGTVTGAQWTNEVTTPAVWVRWHLGVFTATMPPYEYDGHSDVDGPLVWRPLELADRSHFWQTDETPDPVTVPAGTDVVQFVRDDLAVRFNEMDATGVVNSGKTASQDYVFDAGTAWLAIYNTILGAVGNEPLHTDADGLPRSRPLEDPEKREAEHDYTFGTTVVPTVKVEAVNPDLPNVLRFVARRSDDLTEEGAGIRTIVNDATGPGSRQQRGGRTVLMRIDVDAQTQDELDAQARAQAPFYFAGGGLRYVGQVGLNPRHDDSDVVFLERPALGISGNWLVTAWSIKLGDADAMRVMDLQLEQLTGAAFVSQTPVPVGAFGTASFGTHEFGGPI